MTSVWGPLGWMTLHSVSTTYSENPTPSEKQLMYSWLELFRDTITCPHCKEHFGSMLQNYRARFPRMLDSRQEFAMFVFRAHNAVNARLHKPVYSTLAECMDILRTNTKTRSAADYRVAYLNHITRYWKTLQDVTGIVALKKVNELKKIEIEYISPKDTHFTIDLSDQGVVIPREWLEGQRETENRSMRINLPSGAAPRVGFQLVGGRMRLR